MPIADNTYAVVAGDLNRDGALDLIVGNHGQNLLYLNDGHGAFLTGTAFGGAELTTDLALGDLNGDRSLDIIAYNVGAPSVIYLNDGAGNLAQHATFAAAAEMGDEVTLGDLDGDNDYDLIAARAQGSSTVYQNDGQGHFTELRSLAAGYGPLFIDEYGDSDLDLFLLQRDTAQPTRSALYRYRNDGRGGFSSMRINLSGGKPFAQQLAAGDIDGDGDVDLVLSSMGIAGCDGSDCEELRLYLNRGLFGFAAIKLDSAGAETLALVDLDNDGDLDITAAGLVADGQLPGDAQSRVYLNNGINGLLQTASFARVNVGAPQIQARDLTVSDLDNDGLLDVVLASTGANPIYQSQSGYFFGSCETNLLLLDPRLMADLNGDGYQDLVLQSGLILLNDRTGNFRADLSLPLLLDLGSDLATAD
ncbi:MAG: VCBS repeat-containing protein, partial [Caldilineaceae bacterium]|nr:VCBS repeat-containing protein [Caldilineaceae bacterium]